MIKLRKVDMKDMGTVLRWRNDPKNYKFSISGRPYEKGEFKQFFGMVVREELGMKGWIITDGKTDYGFVRIEPMYGATELSLFVASSAHGQGIGTKAIKKALREIKGQVIAQIVPQNLASKAAFEKAGFSFLMKSPPVEIWSYGHIVD